MKKLLTTATLFTVSLTVAMSAPNTKLISVLCNSGEYTSGNPFAISLAFVLSDLVENTPTSKSRDYYDISPYPISFAYGHAACRADLTSTDCSHCLNAAAAQLNTTCSMRIGGRAELADCKIRYEQYPFAG